MLLISPGFIPISLRRLSKNGWWALYLKAELTTLSAKFPPPLLDPPEVPDPPPPEGQTLVPLNPGRPLTSTI